jgi:hypothetical protein
MFKNTVALDLNCQLELKSVLEAPIKKISFNFLHHGENTYGEEGQKQERRASLRRSPRIHDKMRQMDAEPKRGDGPVGRGGKVWDQFSMGSQGKQLGYTSSSSSASPSPDVGNEGVNVAMSSLK